MVSVNESWFLLLLDCLVIRKAKVVSKMIAVSMLRVSQVLEGGWLQGANLNFWILRTYCRLVGPGYRLQNPFFKWSFPCYLKLGTFIYSENQIKSVKTPARVRPENTCMCLHVYVKAGSTFRALGSLIFEKLQLCSDFVGTAKVATTDRSLWRVFHTFLYPDWLETRAVGWYIRAWVMANHHLWRGHIDA